MYHVSIVNIIIPRVVSTTISSLLPPDLGAFFLTPHHRVACAGQFSVVGDIPNVVWEANLDGVGEHTDKAKALLEGTGESCVLMPSYSVTVCHAQLYYIILHRVVSYSESCVIMSLLLLLIHPPSVSSVHVMFM